MKSLLLLINLIVSLSVIVSCRKGFGPTEQEWGFVTVREGAHMFWWLHHTTANVTNYTERPLIIWLQGGPGTSSTGYGNFAEIGVLDADLNPRNSSWVQYANVLFVDNPVGTGYSYAESLDFLTTTNRQIAGDFLVLLRRILEVLPELKSVPIYIFGESYGGKMAAEIALVISQAVKNDGLEANLIGIGLGDSWISPIDSVMSWAPYLLNLGIVDQSGFKEIQASAEATKEAFQKGNFAEATTLWSSTEAAIELATDNVDLYNVLYKIQSSSLKSHTKSDDEKIRILMNGAVKEALQLNQSWGFQQPFVFMSLREDFMKNVTDIVEILLNTTEVKVAVYNGQLDLLVNTLGTMKWVDGLRFKDSDLWKDSDRNSMAVDGVVEGYSKKLNNLGMYWVNRAGHMVPYDNPAGMYYILEDLTQNFASHRMPTSLVL